MDDLSVLLFQNDISPNLSFCLLPPLFDLHFWISTESVKNNSQKTHSYDMEDLGMGLEMTL